jgi:hypothetical protein
MFSGESLSYVKYTQRRGKSPFVPFRAHVVRELAPGQADLPKRRLWRRRRLDLAFTSKIGWRGAFGGEGFIMQG